MGRIASCYRHPVDNILVASIVAPMQSPFDPLDRSMAPVRGRGLRNQEGPMSYAQVTIMAPDSETPFQTGFTDRNGIFSFSPDSKGKYLVTVGDGMGHQLVRITSYNVCYTK